MSSLPSNHIVITCKVHPDLIEKLEHKGMTVTYRPSMQYNELIGLIPSAHGLIVSTQIRVDRAMLNEAKLLQWIGRMGSGMEHIDVEYARQKGIRCVSSPEGNSRAVGEFTLGLMLSLFRNIHKSGREVMNMIWEREQNRGPEISQCTIGIVGYGNTGRAVAELLSCFGAGILVYDKYLQGFGNAQVIESSWDDLLEKADLVSFHIPLNHETQHLINVEMLQSFKKRPFLINASRGGILDTGSLITALEQGWLKGAALDVLENEKINELTTLQSDQLKKLQSFPNVIITPHLAGYSNESTFKMGETLLKKLGLS